LVIDRIQYNKDALLSGAPVDFQRALRMARPHLPPSHAPTCFRLNDATDLPNSSASPCLAMQHGKRYEQAKFHDRPKTVTKRE
jgi:hypothetical protein